MLNVKRLSGYNLGFYDHSNTSMLVKLSAIGAINGLHIYPLKQEKTMSELPVVTVSSGFQEKGVLAYYQYFACAVYIPNSQRIHPIINEVTQTYINVKKANFISRNCFTK